MFGAQKNLIKQKNPSSLLQVSSVEWEAAKALAQTLVNNGKIPPFKISRQELYKQDPGRQDFFNHSFFIFPPGEGDTSINFKVAATSRAKAYINKTTKQEVEEGILGRGGFGMVKIIQWEDNSVDAIKIESMKGNRENLLEKQILQELGYLKATFVRNKNQSKPNEQKIKYTVQKKISGINMRNYFESISDPSAMSDIQKYEIGLKAALTLKELHVRDILHCDIKPENFMINMEGDTALITAIDFGLSKKLESGQTRLKSRLIAVGTPGYMAPEMDSGVYSQKTDIYALGVMFNKDLKLGGTSSPFRPLIELMTNRKPDLRPSIEEVITELSNPENCKKFARIQQYLVEYKDVKKRQPWFFQDLRLSHKEQSNMAVLIEKIVKEYKIGDNQGNIEFREKSANEILSIMKENQNRHEKSVFSTPSTFNLKVLQTLPEALRSTICKRLNIEESSDILKDTSYSTRKKLASVISKYKPIENIPKINSEEDTSQSNRVK